jgi:hypothetical protein
MRGYLVVYDNVQQRIGWIRRNCHNRPTRMSNQFTSFFNWTNYLSQSILWTLKFVGYKMISGLVFWVSSQAVSLRFFLSLTMKDGQCLPILHVLFDIFSHERHCYFTYHANLLLVIKNDINIVKEIIWHSLAVLFQIIFDICVTPTSSYGSQITKGKGDFKVEFNCMNHTSMVDWFVLKSAQDLLVVA